MADIELIPFVTVIKLYEILLSVGFFNSSVLDNPSSSRTINSRSRMTHVNYK